jgi:hypothetical protein
MEWKLLLGLQEKGRKIRMEQKVWRQKDKLQRVNSLRITGLGLGSRDKGKKFER